MAQIKFGTQSSIPYIAHDLDGMSIGLKVAGVINVEQELSEAEQSIIISNTILALQEVLSELNAMQIKWSELPSHTTKINISISEKLAAKGYKTTIHVKVITIDEESKILIDEYQKKSLDPRALEVAAAAEAAHARAHAQAGAISGGRPKFCPNCGTPTGASGNFCSNCGSKLI